MAQSRSGNSGKSRSSKSTKKNTASRSRSAASGRSRSSGGTSRQASRRSQRRAQSNNLMASVVLTCLGLLSIALVLVPGAALWNTLRGWMFGCFGIVTYLIGPFLLYLAYLMAAG